MEKLNKYQDKMKELDKDLWNYWRGSATIKKVSSIAFITFFVGFCLQ